MTSNEGSSRHTVENLSTRRLRAAELFSLELQSRPNRLKLTMTSTSSDAEMSYDLEIRFIAGYDIEIEEESTRELRTSRSPTSSDKDVASHADDPLTDEERTVKYEQEKEADEELERNSN